MASGMRATKGYRLLLLNTNDRELAINLRSQLLQRYPEEKVYMSFQPPYIKLKFGNFLERDDADKFRKDLLRTKIVAGNIYIVPEIVEVKADKEETKP